MAIISDAAVILNPVSLIIPPLLPPRPVTIFLSARSFMSITRFHSTVRGSIPTPPLGFCMSLSINVANRLFAFSMAAKSPVKCKLISSMGTTCE